MANPYDGDYLYPEDDPSYNQDLEPLAPESQLYGATGQDDYQGDYLYPEDDPSYTPTPQPRLQHTPPQQTSPQLFPEGQDHVAREVLGLKPKPYQRSEILPESHFGILGDIGSGLASGVLNTGEMALRSYRTLQDMVPGDIDGLREWTTKSIDTIKGYEEEYPEIFKMSKETENSTVRKAIYGGFRGFVPSATFGALGAVVGGGALGFALGAGGTFALAEYDQFMEDAESAGLRREDVYPEAITSAAVEGVGEAVADMIGYKILKLGGGVALPTFTGNVKNLLKMGVGGFFKAQLKQIPVEVGTEMFQGGSQTFLRNVAGMDAGDPWKQAVESIGPAVVMTMLFGAYGAGRQTTMIRNARKALTDGSVDPAKRQNAADLVTAEIEKVDKTLASLWRFNTKQYIDNGYGIPIDRATSEYLSWGEAAGYSSKFAEDLAAGKDIKLLPAPERGFVMVGESYDPDDRTEYDTYSPEFAQKIKDHTETKQLPPGTDFTMDGKTYTAYSPTLREAKLKKEGPGGEVKQLPMPPAEFESELTDAGELVRTPVEPQLEPLALPPGQGFTAEDLSPEEAAARGVESALETGTPEEVDRAARELAARQKAPSALANRVPALVRNTLKAKPSATIGEVYRSVKAKDKTANRQDVAKLVRQERKIDFPTTKEGLKKELDSLGQEDFNHFYNPLNLEARLVQAMTDAGVSRKEAKAEVRPAIAEYTKNYEAVNKEALKEREEAKKPKVTQAKRKLKTQADLPGPVSKETREDQKREIIETMKDEKPEKPKQAAEAPKKKKVKPKAKKKKLTAKQPKKAAQPTKKKATAAESVAAMGKEKKVTPIVKDTTAKESVTGVFYRTKKEATLAARAIRRTDKNYAAEKRTDDEWIVVEKKPPLVAKKKKAEVIELKPKRKKTKAVLTKKETDKVIKEAELKQEGEEEIKPSALRIGVTIDTPDGKGTIIHSPQEGQWAVRINDKDSWAYGDTLIYGADELAPKKPTKGLKAKFGKAPRKYPGQGVTLKEWRRTKTEGNPDDVEVQYDIVKDGKEVGRIDIAMDLNEDDVYIDWMEIDHDTATGKPIKLSLTEIRGLHKQFKKLWPHVKYLHAIRAHDPRARGITLKAKFQTKENRAIDKVIELTKKTGGATVNMVTGEDMSGTANYAVGVFPGETVEVTGELTPTVLAEFIADNKDKLDSKDFNLGTWVDKEGTTHIDISVAEKELWKAVTLAKEFGQQAIWDLQGEEELETKSDMKGKAKSLEEVVARMAELENDTPVTIVRYMEKKVNPAGTDTGSIDPSDRTHRTALPGKEQERLQGDKDTPNRVHYYVSGMPVEPHVAKLPYKYETTIPRSKLYDTVTDPLNLTEKAKPKGQVRANPNITEKMMREAGYWGYTAPGGAHPSTVVVFEQLPVSLAKKDKARSSKSIAKQAAAEREQDYVAIIRRAMPTATSITPIQGYIGGYNVPQNDSFDVIMPNGSHIQVKFNAMPQEINVTDFQQTYDRDISGEIPVAIWSPGPNVTITGEGTIWLAGLGELVYDVPHEVWHAAKDIVLTRGEEKQLRKDYPGPDDTQNEREAEAYEKWFRVQDSNAIFDKVRTFFMQIAETFGIGKGKSYKIFRAVETGKAWERPLAEVSSKGRLYDSINSLMTELPKYKRKSKAAQTVRTNREDILNDRDHWERVGAVLYIEGLKGKAWTEEMKQQLKFHYGIDKIPQAVLTTIRKDSQHIFEKRAVETLSQKLPTMEALMAMEQRGAKEGGIVWYDEADGLSTIAMDSNGDLVARSALSELQEYFGEDAELVAGLIAHLSSGLQVPLNTTKAIEVYIAHKLGLGFKGTYQVTKEQVDNFLETRKTSGPKREPFFQAIMGDADAIVIDRWMARVLDFRTKNAKTGEWQTSVGASDEQRMLLIEWVKRGAKRLGISNRAYQAMIWAGKKAIDEELSGRPTGSLKPLAEVIEEKVKMKGILAKDIPVGKEDEYFILKGMDRWAIHKDSFMPLADLELFPKWPKKKKPAAISVPRLPTDVITAAEQAELDKQQPRMFAKMSNQTMVEDSLNDMFGGKQKGLLQKMLGGIKRWKEFRTLVLDEFHPILKHLGEKTYKLHRMLNGVHASVEAFMRHGKLTLDDEGHIVADGINRGFAVWAKKHGKDAVNVLRWAAAKRSEQLEKDNSDWLKNEEFLTEAKRERIYREVGEAPEGGGTWEELHAEFDEFHQSVLDIAEKAGLIDSVVREDWRDLIYVPFYRVFEDTATREEFLANPRKAKDIAAKVKPIKGSARKIGEPIENVIANWGYMIQESMRNQARAEAYVSAKMLNEVSDLMRDIDYQEIKHTIVNDKGVITYETERGDDMVLSFLDNGKRKYFAVHDADLYYALTTMNAQHFGKLFNAFFGGPKRLLTYGATFGPAFRVANAVRDTLHTWMITPGMSFTPFLSTAKGFMSSMREDEHYVAALAAAGLHGGSYVHAEDPASMSKFTKRLLGKQGKSANLIDTLGKALDMWDRIGAASENAARVQLHRQLLEQGETGLEAAYQSRDLLDFALKGQSQIVLALIRTIPFLGARTQGNYRLVRAAIDPKTRYSMAIKGAILAAASLALWASFKDDDRYKELEDYDKWTYYHWWIGDEHYRMPKPFEVGAIFSSMFESVANTMHGNEEMEFMARFFKHTFTETFAVGVPQTVKPLAELWANKSFFTGRPIEGKAMKLLEPGERAEPWTPETLQLLGKGLNISPKKMEALLRGYLATISAFALGGTDQIARWVGDFPERPKYRSDDYPLIGRFWKQGPARNTKYATRIYELMEESDRLVQTVKHYMIEGDMKKAKKLADSNLGLFSANKMLNRTRKKMSQLRRVMKDVEIDRKLSRAEKRKKLDDLTVLRNSLVKDVYEVLGAEIK